MAIRSLRSFLAAAMAMASICTANPTIANSSAAENTAGVLPLKMPEQANPEIKNVQDRLYRLALHQARHILTLVHPWSEDPGMKLATESKSIEHFIRPNTGAIAAFAFLYRFGPYDEKVVGLSRAELLEKYIIPMIRYIASTHVAGSRPTSDGKHWGDHWQSAYWASMLGRSAWWLWADLPGDLREGVRRVVAHEAQRYVDKIPPHNLASDTKAEENAWNSMIFDMAILLMPHDPRRPAWEKAFQYWAMSSYLRPADEHSPKIVDGRPVSAQFNGPNLYDDFTLENHDRIHPDYMGCFTLTLTCAVDQVLSGRRPPEAILHNVREVYENLKWFFLPDGGCVYPNGQDWDLFNNTFNWLEVNGLMAAVAGDADAWTYIKRNVATGEKMQARDSTGALYEDEETVYGGQQLLAGEELGREWLALQSMNELNDRPRPLLGVKRLDIGKLIIHRTPNAIHTLSWGAVVMAQCVPWRMDRVVSPDQRDGVGHVRLKNDKKILPVKLVSADVQDSPDGFTAHLTLDHGDAVRAELRFRSNADGSFVIEEKLAALEDIATDEIATGLIGVLNNPKWIYETHRRKISFDGRTAEVPCLSGKSIAGDGVRRIGVDGALSIESRKPLSARYLGAKKIDRGRATDKLYLNYLDGEREWKKGQAISTYEAAITPQADPGKE
ncbi:MAG: hypothetical protein IT426_12160 [Pirellulales bacterium]|nr:hypothetical protein [Pirellulales bacterium]